MTHTSSPVISRGAIAGTTRSAPVSPGTLVAVTVWSTNPTTACLATPAFQLASTSASTLAEIRPQSHANISLTDAAIASVHCRLLLAHQRVRASVADRVTARAPFLWQL